MIGNFFRAIGTAIWNTIQKIGYGTLKVSFSQALSLATLAIGVKGYMQARQMMAKGQDILANKTAAGGKIPVVYGTRRVGAQVVYMDVSNNDSRHVFLVYALSIGECEEVLGRTIELDGNPLTDSARFKYGCYIGSDKISSGSGSLNTVTQVGSTISAGAGGFGTSPTSRYRITFNIHHGAASQTADPMLVASMPNWTTSHRLDGICYIATHYKFDKEGMFAGIPQMTVQVRGKKVYDPRDSGQTFGTPSTYEYSDNPALCFLDLISNNEYGKGLTASQLNMSTFSSAANVCDTQVDQPYFNGTAQSLTWSANSGDNFFSIGGVDPNDDWWQNKIGELLDLFDTNGNGVIDGAEIVDIQRSNFFDSNEEFLIFINGTFGSTYSSQTGTSLLKVKRFHCNGYLDTNKNVMENAKELLANMRGIFLYINGQYELSIEDTGSSSFSINDNHIISDAGISVDYGNKDKKANKVIIEFFNANKKYELDTATVLHDATPEYYSDDNDEILEIKAEFPYITDPYIAYNMGKAILTRSRNQTTMQFLGTPEMYKLNVGDIVDLTYAGLGFSGKVCRVEALELQPNGLVAVSLIEYFNVYTWEVPPQEPVEELANLPSAYAVKKPTNLTFTDSNSSSIGRPILSWDAPTDYPDYEFRVNVVDSSGNQLMNKIVNTTEAELNFTPTGNNYVASITSLNTLGTESDATTLTFSVTTAPVGQGDVQADVITANEINVNQLSAISADMGSITAGDLNIGSGNFTVSTAGVMTATGATISGNLTATSLNVTNATVTGTLDASVITLNNEPLDNVLTYSETGGIGLLTLNEGAAIDGDFVVSGNFEAIGLQPDLIIGKVTGDSSDTIVADAILRSDSGGGSFKIQAGSSNTTKVSLGFDALGGTTLLGDTGAGGSTGKVRINVDGSLGMEFNESRNATFTGEVKTDALELPSNTPSTTTNKLYNSSGTLYFNGSAVGGGGTGDITSVVAGTNLNGGGTSGDVTVNLDTNLSGLGTVSATEFDLPSGGMLDWANGDARIVEGLVNNYSLSFQTWDGSSVSTALRLDGNNTATFTGTISSGSITTTGSITIPDSQPIKWATNNILSHNGTTTYLGDNTSASTLSLTGGNVNLESGAKFFFNGTSNYGVGAGGHNYVSVYVDTLESGYSNDPLELIYYQGSEVKIGAGATKPLGAGSIKIGSTTVIDSNRNIYANYALLGRGFRTSNRGELHLNGTNSTDVAEIHFGYGEGYTEGNIRWTISDRGSSDDRLIIYRSPYHSGFTEVASFDASAMTMNIRNGYQVNGTTVIDSSRNLSNIGTIVKDANPMYFANGNVSAPNNSNHNAGTKIMLYDGGTADWYAIGIEGNTMWFNTSTRFKWYQDATQQMILDGANLTVTGNVTAYSDERLKENIETLDGKKALQMRGVSFVKDGVKGSGVIAQEIEEIAPELVLTADDEIGTKSVAYGNLVGYLIEAIKDQQQQIDELKQRLDNDS